MTVDIDLYEVAYVADDQVARKRAVNVGSIENISVRLPQTFHPARFFRWYWRRQIREERRDFRK